MRSLLPEPQADVDVHAHYAAEWVDRGGIRANMIASLDGAVAANGRSAGLQTPGDNVVFGALRELADVVLVGWSTADTEGYRPVTVEGETRARREAFGLAPRLPIAVVSRSLRLDASAPLLAGAADDARTIVVTCASSDAGTRAELAEVADVVVCGDEEIDFAGARRELAARGLVRVLCEGGPRILSAVLAAGELDEFCLSVSPVVVGPGAGRVVAGDEWPGDPAHLRLHGLLEDDGALFARYVRS